MKENPEQALNEEPGWPPSVDFLATFLSLRRLNLPESDFLTSKTDRSGKIPGRRARHSPEQAGGFEFRLKY
ncbi:MAG: hypothetical protein ACXIUM_00390 [Wenzhouxiangella sp.]